MLKFWRTSENSWAYTLTSAVVRVESNPAALVVTDRDGVPHRIATGGERRPVRIAIEVPENAMAATNGEGIAFGDFLIGNMKSGAETVVFESTRMKAYRCVVDRVDERVQAGTDRLEAEPLFVRIEFHVIESGVFTDWGDVFSVAWGV